MRALIERAEALAGKALRSRVEKIAVEWREAGASIVAGGSSVTIEAEGLVRRRLSDFRFVGLGR